MPTDENLSRIYQKGASLVQAGMPAADAYKAIQPDIQKHYYTPENVDRALNSISKEPGSLLLPNGGPMPCLGPRKRSRPSTPKFEAF